MTAVREFASYPDTKLLIDNQWTDGADGRTVDVVNPATEVRIGTVACAAVEDLDRALSAAKRGFEQWRNVSAHERAAVVRRAAALLRERAGCIAANLTQEQGKPLHEAHGEVLDAADILEWFAEEGLRVYGRIVPARNPDVQQLVMKEPVGVVAAFTPWNFPINQVARKLGAALATGCSCILKAPEETPSAPAALVAALVTTVAGLLVAIPSMFGYNWLVHNLRVLTVELDNFAQELVSHMETEFVEDKDE